MTEAEKNEIVGLVMTQISSQAVDFDIETEQPQANDLLTAVRKIPSGEYLGVTLKWDDVARIATELANQAATRAEQAETDANNILEQVQSKGTEITNFVATSKAELETQKNESVNAVKSVYQTDLNELKGDLDSYVRLSDGANFYNKNHSTLCKDFNSITGELISGTERYASEFIHMDFTKSVKLIGTTYQFLFCFDENKQFLGYLAMSGSAKIITDTYNTVYYVRFAHLVSEIEVMLMYGKYASSTYIPYNPISKFDEIPEKGYFYLAELNIDTTNKTIALVSGRNVIVCENGYSISTGITNEPISVPESHLELYCTIVYDKKNKTLKTLLDYTGSYEDYVVLGYYEKGYVFGNLGIIKVNGKIANKEISESDVNVDYLRTSVMSLHTSVNTINANVLEETNARTDADNALSARIDNLIAPTGDSVAEITDARVGYGGAIYASLSKRLNTEAGRVRNVLVVGTDGQYHSIASAVSAAKNGDIVFVKRGTYEEHVRNLDKIVHIIGESKEETIWKYPNTDYGSCDCYECGMGSIRNITMWNYDNGGTPSGQYGRSYCIHIDHQSYYQSNPPISNYFYCENVHFINDSNECLGLGLRNNMIMEFVNCEFETLTGNEAAFYVHSASATGAKCILNGCKIRNNCDIGAGTPLQGALRVEGYNNTNKGCTLLLERCIAVNLGTGPDVVWQLNKVNKSAWDDIPDWQLDPCSQLNNVAGMNYSN